MSSKIHPVFHVSCLKQVLGNQTTVQTELLEFIEEGSILVKPETILDRRTCQLRNHTITEVLIQWHDLALKDATWETPTSYINNSLIFSFEEKFVPKRGGMLGSYILTFN